MDGLRYRQGREVGEGGGGDDTVRGLESTDSPCESLLGNLCSPHRSILHHHIPLVFVYFHLSQCWELLEGALRCCRAVSLRFQAQAEALLFQGYQDLTTQLLSPEACTRPANGDNKMPPSLKRKALDSSQNRPRMVPSQPSPSWATESWSAEALFRL